MSIPFHPKRIAVRLVAGFGAVVVALSLVGAQFGLAHFYAGAAERVPLAASAHERLAAAQVRDGRPMR